MARVKIFMRYKIKSNSNAMLLKSILDVLQVPKRVPTLSSVSKITPF